VRKRRRVGRGRVDGRRAMIEGLGNGWIHGTGSMEVSIGGKARHLCMGRLVGRIAYIWRITKISSVFNTGHIGPWLPFFFTTYD
jgi:hypothetical protein